jgi:hypothetical protein
MTLIYLFFATCLSVCLGRNKSRIVYGESIRKFQGEAILGGEGVEHRDGKNGPGDLAAGQLCGCFVYKYSK